MCLYIYTYIFLISIILQETTPTPLQHLIQIRHSFGILFQDRTNRPSLTALASLPWPFETTLDRSGILLGECGSKLGAFDAQSASKPTQNPSKIQSQTSINTPESTIFVFSWNLDFEQQYHVFAWLYVPGGVRVKSFFNDFLTNRELHPGPPKNNTKTHIYMHLLKNVSIWTSEESKGTPKPCPRAVQKLPSKPFRHPECS